LGAHHLKAALNIADLRTMAQARLPKMVFDYIDGGADDERTLHANEARLQAYHLVWDALVNVATVDTKRHVLGADMALPFFVSPTAANRLFHRAGEMAVARAAHAMGIGYSLSTLGSARIEDVAAACPGPKFFQVYVWKDRGLVREGLARAKAAGFTAAILTVDVPVAGNRERDPRNGFAIPPRLSPKLIAQAALRPRWSVDLITSPPIQPENFAHLAPASKGGVIDFINAQFDRTVTWADAAWMAQIWDGPFAIKGVATAADARRCIDAGASAVWVSNHGGRQLDTALATIDCLPAIVDAVAGDAEIIFDGGVRRGSDIVKALALGANAVALGRAVLWGLAAAGEPGVRRALDILRTELIRTLQLLGAPRLGDLRADMIRPPH
jgi:L-lactate dehydrogenase (cytochrome)